VKRVTARKAKIKENGEGNAKIDGAASASGRKHENQKATRTPKKHTSRKTRSRSFQGQSMSGCPAWIPTVGSGRSSTFS
jgi:hypothetical protein